MIRITDTEEQEIEVAQVPKASRGYVRIDSLEPVDPRPDQKVYFPDKDTTRAYPAAWNEDEMGYDAQVEIYGKPKGNFMMGIDMGKDWVMGHVNTLVDTITTLPKGAWDFFPTTGQRLVGGTMISQAEMAEEVVPLPNELAAAIVFGNYGPAVHRVGAGLAARGISAMGFEEKEQAVEEGYEFINRANKYIESRNLDSMNAAQKFGYDIGGGMASMLSGLALLALSKGKAPEAVSLLFGQIAYVDKYLEERGKDQTPREAHQTASMNRGTEVMLESLGLRLFTRYLRGSKSPTRQIANAMVNFTEKVGIEAGQEGGQTLGGKLASEVAGTNTEAWGDIWKEVGYSALIGAVAAGPGAAIQVALDNKSLRGRIKNELGATEKEADEFIKTAVPAILESTLPTVERAIENEMSEVEAGLQKTAEAQGQEKKMVEGGEEVFQGEEEAKAEVGGKVAEASEIAEEEGDISFNVEEFDAVEEVKPEKDGRSRAEKRLDEILDAKSKRATAKAMLNEIQILAENFRGRIKDKEYEGQKVPRYFRTTNENALTIDEALDEARNDGWGANFEGTSDFAAWLRNTDKSMTQFKKEMGQASEEVGTKKVTEETVLKKTIQAEKRGEAKGVVEMYKELTSILSDASRLLKNSSLAEDEKAELLELLASPEKITTSQAIKEAREKVNKAGKKVRGLAKGVEEKAIENKLTDSLGELPEYETVNMKDQAAKAAQIISEDYERAKRIAMGEEEAPEGVLPESLFVAVENKAITEGDVETIKALATSSNLVSEATLMGQRIRTLAERDPLSPVTAITSVAKAREEMAKRRSKAKDIRQAKKKEVGKIEKKIKEAGPKMDEWQAFIKELEC